MTALIAVLASAGPAIKELFVPSDSHILATVAGQSSNGLTILVSNDGRKVGAIRAALLEIFWSERSPGAILTSKAVRSLYPIPRDPTGKFMEGSAPVFVKPGASDRLDLLVGPDAPVKTGKFTAKRGDAIDIDLLLQSELKQKSFRCQTQLSIVNGSGTESQLVVPFECIRAYSLVRALL